MQARTTNLLLWSAGAALLLASAAMLAWAGLGKPDVTISPAHPAVDARDAGKVNPSGIPPLSAFATVWDRDLRGGQLGAPTPATAPAHDARPVLTAGLPPIRLVATMIEPGRSLALFITPDAKTEFKSVGEETAGAMITRIDNDSATLLFDGTTFTVEREKKSASTTRPAADEPADKESAAQDAADEKEK